MRIIFLLFLTIGFLSASSKVALVIGNSNYSTKPLPNAKQDAKDIRDKLKSLGYDVVFAPNANVAKFSQAITEFHKKVIRADIAVVFYAGHGIEIGGENYMIPLGVNAIYTRRDLANLIKLSDIIAEAEIAKSFGVLFIDACRENPLKNRIDPTIRSGVTRGLGQVDTPSNILVSFATKAQQVVNDGDGKNSPYTTALKEFITKQEDIRFVIGKIKDKVVKETRNSQVRQEPTMFGTLGGSHYCLSGSCGESQVRVVEKIVYRDRVVEPTSVVPTPVVSTSTSKWMTPIDKYVTWKKAKEICRASGGRLPRIEELKKVVTDCGGIVNSDFLGEDASKNKKNNHYQNCHKKKGFISNDYWSTTYASDTNYAWVVNFYYGNTYGYPKSDNRYVRCVRAGQ